jgi:hypothetical protein
MNYQKLITAIKQAYEQNSIPELAYIRNITSDQLLHRYFINYRTSGQQSAGIGLSDEGLQAFKTYFQYWIIQMPDSFIIKSKHLIYLDRITIMPWHLNSKEFTTFDPEIGMKLRLVGDLDVLMAVFENPISFG